MPNTTETALILEAIKNQGDSLTHRMDSQQKELSEVKDVVVQLARIEERQVAHDVSSKEQVNRIHAKIEKNTLDIDKIQTELSENRWLFKLANSIITKAVTASAIAGGLGAAAYKVLGA